MRDLYFDDFVVGQRFKSRAMTLSEAQILDFAWAYDPQPFHIDKLAAAEGAYGGLIASGFQTLAIAFRLFYQESILVEASLGSPGIDELRWLKPVRPGDTLHTEAEVLEKRASKSKPDRGVLRMGYTAVNQDGEGVLSYTIIHILRRRAPGDLEA
jgi:acyl dehydratase